MWFAISSTASASSEFFNAVTSFRCSAAGGPDQPGKPVLPAELLPEQRLKNPAEYLKRPIAAGLQQQKVKITVGKIGFLGRSSGVFHFLRQIFPAAAA